MIRHWFLGDRDPDWYLEWPLSRRLQAERVTEQYLGPREAGIKSCIVIPAWKVKRERIVEEMHAREASKADKISGARKVLMHHPRPSPVTRNGAA